VVKKMKVLDWEKEVRKLPEPHGSMHYRAFWKRARGDPELGDAFLTRPKKHFRPQILMLARKYVGQGKEKCKGMPHLWAA